MLRVQVRRWQAATEEMVRGVAAASNMAFMRQIQLVSALLQACLSSLTVHAPEWDSTRSCLGARCYESVLHARAHAKLSGLGGIRRRGGRR